ncbi:lactadherin-like [Patiria miniata]|uniref:F5/8 type C domain-containing protein n=1 Tax=Patiria miniata TaxID=46514 RepID=A0A914BM74_PATMI|nr:lactadherin-like [Patiria miniata]
MENGQILDHHLSSSSSWNSQTHGPQRARLNQRADPELGLAGGWRADTGSSATGETWIQVDFAQWTNLTGVITQGREDKSEWVTQFKVSYFQNDWLFVSTPGDGQPQEFFGNYDTYHPVTNLFLHQVVAKSVRVHPITWYRRPSMRFELLGCTDGDLILNG